MKTFSQYVTEADQSTAAAPSRLLAQLHAQLEAVGKTMSGVKVHVTDLKGFENSLYVTVEFERHPGDFSEESPGVTCTLRNTGRIIHSFMGFYPNWLKHGEGTRFTASSRKNYSSSPERLPMIASDIMKNAVGLLMAHAKHDPDEYTADMHNATLSQIRADADRRYGITAADYHRGV